MIQKKWLEIRKSGNFDEIARKHNISPILARIIRNKEIVGDSAIEKYLHGGYDDLYDPHLMKDIDKGVFLIRESIEENKKIRIIGDYDIDGVQSTYILYKGLLKCGANVSYAIPDRITDGYGINVNLIDAALNDGVEVIITCDNGISALDAISYAKEHNLTVIVTDHHDIPYEETENGTRIYKKSPADAIINPKQDDCHYPYKGLCGAGVAYKFIQVLYESFGMDESESKVFIENAGFATVGDVMDLTDENRILVKIGLSMLRNTTNIGMNALIEANNLDKTSIDSYHIGFVLGPCINASGRLDTAVRSLKLLLTENIEEAKKLAAELLEFNTERKNMTEKGVEEAIAQVEASEMKNDRVLVVYLPSVHESIAGIVAGRIREKYYKPVFVLTKGESGVKGSGRSIEEYSMYDELVKCSELLDKFGGHPMAAGLSLMEENIDTFRKKLNDNCTLSDDEMTEKVRIDAVVPIDCMTMDITKQLSLLEPCGKANTKPVFAARNVRVTGAKVLGQNRNAIRLNLVSDSGATATGITFGDADLFLERLEEKFGIIEKDLLLQGKAQHTILNMLFYPKVNVWNGTESLQIVINDIL